MRYTLSILSLAVLMICSSCNPNVNGQKEDDGQVSSSLAYPKAEVKTADMACQCFSPLAEFSVVMQDWAAEHYDEMFSEGNDMEEAVTTLREMEKTYFDLLEEARACYEDSLTSFGDFYMRGAPAFPFLYARTMQRSLLCAYARWGYGKAGALWSGKYRGCPCRCRTTAYGVNLVDSGMRASSPYREL